MSNYYPPSSQDPGQFQGPPSAPPYYQPMQPPPPRKKRKTLLVVLIVLLLILGACIGTVVIISSAASKVNAPSSSSSTTTTTSSGSGTWTTTHTFRGSGIKKTAVLSVPGDWKITWSCKPSSFDGNYNVQVYVYNSDGSIADVAINEICKSDNTSGETKEHQSGNVYLEVNSEGQWTVNVQEQK